MKYLIKYLIFENTEYMMNGNKPKVFTIHLIMILTNSNHKMMKDTKRKTL